MTMNATDFMVKLKADGSAKDWLDLDEAFRQYQNISAGLPTADRGPFAVNVLCTLCRNIEKVQSWPSAVDLKCLLTLAIDCVRCTRGQDNSQRARSLVCVYHLQRYVVRQMTQKLPPELIIKLSYMPFENPADELLRDYHRTYWNLLIDRLAYIQKLKIQNMAISKLFPKLSDDIFKIIEIYETVPFCNTVLTFLIAKLHSIYSDCHSKELNGVFGKIFQSLSLKSDIHEFKMLTATQSLDLYSKFSECFYNIAENSSKNDYEESVLPDVVRCCVTMLGHFPEIWHCLHTLYLNGFCMILAGNTKRNGMENILSNIHISCENTAKLGYTKILMTSYPFLNQFLRLYIEYFISNSNKLWSLHFNALVQETCLIIMSLFIKNLKNCNQQIKCEGCKVRTGQHDALRLSFLVKHFVSISIQENIDITTILPSFTSVVFEQYSILKQLCALGCNSYDKYYKKLQADVHNSAILLYKACHYDCSIELFNLYLDNEIMHFKTESELKNISRALFNKSICELDYKLHENALKDAYLSLVFAYPESLNSDKYMSLVMDIKAKALKCQNTDECDDKSQKSDNSDNKSVNDDRTQSSDRSDNKSRSAGRKDGKSESTDDNDNQNTECLQLMTVLDACQSSLDCNYYGNLKPFFCNLNFSTLLKHEFSMYAKLWPAILPVAGVWRSMMRLHYNEIAWIKVKDENEHRILYEIILETTNSVRTIYNDQMSLIVKQLVDDFEKNPAETVEMELVRASLLFLKAEYDLHEASEKFGWKVTGLNQEEESCPARTVAQEHAAAGSALAAAGRWTAAGGTPVPDSALVRLSLQCAAHAVPLLLQLNKLVHALSLAHVSCGIAKQIGDKLTYIRLASTIISHALSSSEQMESIIREAKLYWQHLMASRDSVDEALVFLCEIAMYYARTDRVAVSAKLVQLCQAYTLDACHKYPDIKLEIPVGKLIEAQSLLCADRETSVAAQSMLSAVNCAHRHYVATGTSRTTWSTRRFITTTVRHLSTEAGIAACARAKAALLLRRARVAAVTAQVYANAVGLAKLSALTANTHCTVDTQVKIDNRLKYVLGIPSYDQNYTQSIMSKKEPTFTPKHDIETMLENMTFKQNQLSPSLPSKIPGFKCPDFLTHDRSCQCHNCQNPVTFVLTCQTVALEASMYFRAKEYDIAKNYFEGCVKCFSFAEAKLKSVLKGYRDVYEGYIVDMVEKCLWDDLRHVQLEMMIENAFFELSQKNDREADEIIVAIHEILHEYKDVDMYLRNEVFNLLAAAAKLRTPIKVPQMTDLENKMDHLKLSPAKTEIAVELAKTPENKPENPPKVTKNIVSDEEIPNIKRKVIKLDLDDDVDEEKEKESNKRSSKRTLKVPKLVVTKPELETMTPMPKTCKKRSQAASIDLTTEETYDFATPRPKNAGRKPNNTIKDLNVDNLEFATPMLKTDRRKLTKSKSVQETTYSVTDTNDSVQEKSDSKIDNTSVLDFVTPKPTTEPKRITKSKRALEISNTVQEKNHSLLEKNHYVTPNPNIKRDDFFTPMETPADQFFTPMTSVKTYEKKSLRLGIVKSLRDFATPKMVSINENVDTNQTVLDVNAPIASKTKSGKVETGYIKTLKDKKALKRATSPGKLEKSRNSEKKPASKPERPTRLRKPVRFSIEKSDDDS